jgi:hypothetical protein
MVVLYNWDSSFKNYWINKISEINFLKMTYFLFSLNFVLLQQMVLMGKAHKMTQGQEVKFHEIEIQLFQEIKFLIMRSKLCLFMR